MGNLDLLFAGFVKAYSIYLILGIILVGIYVVATRGKPWGKIETLLLIIVGGGFVFPIMVYITIATKFKKYINGKT